MKLSGRKIYPGKVEGEVLAASQGISFFGGIDPESGVVVERGHELEGQSVDGKVLVFPMGKGSTVGSYSLYRMKAAGTSPLAIINHECETITAVGCIIAEIPCVDRVAIDRLSTGQFVRIDGEAGWVQILKPASPPSALCGSEGGTFAERTLSARLPDIARRIMGQREWAQAQLKNLQMLADDMPQGRIRLLAEDNAPDIALWQEWLKPHLGKTWLEAPWFPAEVYFFRRILEASGYFQNGLGQAVDPYRYEKLAGMSEVDEKLAPVCSNLTQAAAEDSKETLVRLLHTVIWGNQADMSIWPAGSEPPASYTGEQRRAHLLVDHSDRAADFIVNGGDGLGQIDFILDNVGLELAYDLLLADFFLQRSLAKQVVFQTKPFPTYVSDATIQDVYEMITHLQVCEIDCIRDLGMRLHTDLESGRLVLRTNYYWISPLVGWEMPDEMRAELGQADLLISKGDANYRRWLGDRHWEPDLPIDGPLAYRPAPLLLIRVLKAEMVTGLKPGQAEQMDQDHPGWMTSGQWGVIQFVD